MEVEPIAQQPDVIAAGAGTTAGPTAEPRGSVIEVLAVATRLGLTSFGGPVAHIGYFRAEYVERRGWIDEATFADLVALCQSLPGPTSSKIGIAIGILRAGLAGGVAAWIGFTLPSAIALVLFALGTRNLGPEADGWLHGLKVVAVPVVALAVWSMARSLAFDRPRGTIAVLAAIAVLAIPTGVTQLVVIGVSALLGWRLLGSADAAPVLHVAVPIGRRLAISCAVLFFALLVALPLARQATGNQVIAMLDSFYRPGALVFGGGHVVLPLLQTEVVTPGWVSNERFLIGYGAAQAVPGPLFSFAAYLGAVLGPQPNGLLGAAIALVAIFLPAFLLTIATLPGWGAARSRASVQAALRGVGAAVVGILLAALYDPVATSAILRPTDFALGLAAFGALAIWKLPPWLVVVLTAAGGSILAAIT
jgi:chromate transporter